MWARGFCSFGATLAISITDITALCVALTVMAVFLVLQHIVWPGFMRAYQVSLSVAMSVAMGGLCCDTMVILQLL